MLVDFQYRNNGPVKSMQKHFADILTKLGHGKILSDAVKDRTFPPLPEKKVLVVDTPPAAPVVDTPPAAPVVAVAAPAKVKKPRKSKKA